MPTRDFVESVKNRTRVDNAIVEPEVDALDSAEVADEILKQPNILEITLLDGEVVKMRKDFTLNDFFKKRLDAKLIALEQALNVANKKHKGTDASTAGALIMSSDEIQDITLDIVAKLADVDRDIFDENISGMAIAGLTIELMNILKKLAEKQGINVDGGKKAKKAQRTKKA